METEAQEGHTDCEWWNENSEVLMAPKPLLWKRRILRLHKTVSQLHFSPSYPPAYTGPSLTVHPLSSLPWVLNENPGASTPLSWPFLPPSLSPLPPS